MLRRGRVGPGPARWPAASRRVRRAGARTGRPGRVGPVGHLRRAPSPRCRDGTGDGAATGRGPGRAGLGALPGRGRRRHEAGSGRGPSSDRPARPVDEPGLGRVGGRDGRRVHLLAPPEGLLRAVLAGEQERAGDGKRSLRASG